MILYHYGRTETIFNILQSKSLRLSDIRKSNDYKEMELFYPNIIYRIWNLYCENPFPFEYVNEKDKDAMYELLDTTRNYIDQCFVEGTLSNYVVCFSEKADLLSQWRGYANAGKGCCIGFDEDSLKEYCDRENVLTLEKVEYLEDSQIEKIVTEYAKSLLDQLQHLREWIVAEMTKDNKHPETDGLLEFNFSSMIEAFLNDSLKFKKRGFAEEKEWRLYMKSPAYKYGELLFGEKRKLTGPDRFKETVEFLRNRVDFSITEDNIVPYIAINFEEFDDNLLKEIWLGPKSRILEKDINLYLLKHHYKDVQVRTSDITFI